MKPKGRPVLRVFCNRAKDAHEIARVTAQPGGAVVVTVSLAVRDVGGFVALQKEQPLEEFTFGVLLLCAACSKVYPTAPLLISDAVQRRLRTLRLEPLGFHRDPIGMLRKRYPDVASHMDRHSAATVDDTTSPTAG